MSNGLNTPDEMGHDIQAFIRLLKESYPDSTLTKQKLKKRVLYNLLDPFSIYSLFADLNYIFTVKNTKLYMIPIKGVYYLPSYQLRLAPFGTEHYSEHFFVSGEKVFHGYVRFGNDANNKYYGMGIFSPNLYTYKNVCLGFRGDVYHQPNIRFYKEQKSKNITRIIWIVVTGVVGTGVTLAAAAIF